MKIDNILLDKLTAQAKESPRLRSISDFIHDDFGADVGEHRRAGEELEEEGGWKSLGSKVIVKGCKFAE